MTPSVAVARSLARQALEFKRDAPAVATQARRLRHDSLFRMRNVTEGLLDRPSEAPLSHRLAVAGRILVAYGKAKRDQNARSEHYRPSNEWLPIYRKPLKPLTTALEAGDSQALVVLLDQFFRSTVSAGLAGLPTDMTKNFFGKPPSRYRQLQYLVDAVHRWRLLERLLPGVTAADLVIPDTGNPYGLMVDGSFIRTGADYQYYYAHKTVELLAGERHPVIAELGGGIGGYAHFLARLMPAEATYINLDLPEILTVAQYLLMTALPQESFLLYGEVETLNAQSLAKSRLVLMPSFVIEELADASVSLTFNSYSLAEMDPQTIRHYAGEISRVTQTSIFHINHVEQALLGAADFGFDDRFAQVESRRAEWNLGRNLRSDEFEFLLVDAEATKG